ncbi:VOC family protein [Pseudovibrio sp. Ad46]|uniref:VOC family protein n=1 Tax=Pseudovibrio sp. Ad46 TaxID=989432 RepID=UPI0007AE5F73|nr:VOC family protein [Pseudovibrio sp. Ad46]
MMKSGKINYIELPAADLEAVKTFYSNALGWTFEDYGPDYAAFNDGDFNGGFFKAGLSSSTASGAALVVLYAEDLEALQDTLVKNGAKICREIFTFPGGRRFHFLDPNNNELAVWSDK